MRWNLSSNMRLAWHTWYAWHPIKLRDGTRVWLEPIQRKQRYDSADSMLERAFNRLFCLIDYDYRDVDERN